MLLDLSQCFFQQQGKAHLPTLNMPFFERVQFVKTPYPYFLTPPQCFVQQQGKAPLPTLNMPLFERVQLVKPRPCFFTPLHCFVQQQEKAYLHTLNMPFSHKSTLYNAPFPTVKVFFFHKMHVVECPPPCFLTPVKCLVQ